MNKPILVAGLTVLVAICAAAAMACGDDTDNGASNAAATEAASAVDIPVLDVAITDQGYEAPDSVSGGLIRLRVHNRSTGVSGAQLGRLKDGVTIEELHATTRLAAEDFEAALEELGKISLGVTGGVALMRPGASSEVVLDLEPGHYAISHPLAFVAVTRLIEVTAAPEDRPAAPEAQLTISMTEFAYDGAPDTLPPGETTVNVVNEGQQLHMMALQRVGEEGMSAEQVGQSLSGTALPKPPTLLHAGGMGELAPGDSGWAMLDLDPGVYVLYCLVFDGVTASGGPGKLHSQLGMQHVISVE